MAGALAAAGAAIAAADLWLVLICWKHRTVLGAVLGAVGIPLVAFAIASGPTGSTAEGALATALILLIIGVVLYSLGKAFERLLDEPPKEES